MNCCQANITLITKYKKITQEKDQLKNAPPPPTFYKWPGYIRSMERDGRREEAPLFLDPFPRALALSPGCDLERRF